MERREEIMRFIGTRIRPKPFVTVQAQIKDFLDSVTDEHLGPMYTVLINIIESGWIVLKWCELDDTNCYSGCQTYDPADCEHQFIITRPR